MSQQPQAARGDSVDSVLPPPPYTPKVTPPTPVAEEGPSASTGRERGGMSPLTSPDALTRTHQPEHRDPMQLPSGLNPNLSRSHSTRTHRSGNATPSSVAPSTADTRGRTKEARQAEHQQDEPQRHNVVNIFCCCSSPGACPGHFSITLLPTHCCKPNKGPPAERTSESSRPDFTITVGETSRYQARTELLCYYENRLLEAPVNSK